MLVQSLGLGAQGLLTSHSSLNTHFWCNTGLVTIALRDLFLFFSIFIFKLFLRLLYNCFAMLCEFLLCSEVTHLYTYEPPFHPLPPPTPLGHPRAPS